MEEIRNPGQELPEAEAAQAAEVEAVLPAEETAEASAQAEAAAEAETVQIPEPLEKPEQPKRVEVVDVRFRNNAKNYYFDPNGLTLKTGDHVIIETARGDEYGLCAAGNHSVPAGEVVAPLRKVQRLATAQDEKINADNQAKEKKAFDVCMKKIEDHKLDMQLVSAECAFDGSKILFFFTAEGRVDFRELVKDLASVFRTRIELRQIGVRDKAKMVGGLGVCGRPFCCKEFLDDFQPVSIKMAKTQNLSLNPTKISGTCGRPRRRTSHLSTRRTGAVPSPRSICCASASRCAWRNIRRRLAAMPTAISMSSAAARRGKTIRRSRRIWRRSPRSRARAARPRKRTNLRRCRS